MEAGQSLDVRAAWSGAGVHLAGPSHAVSQRRNLGAYQREQKSQLMIHNIVFSFVSIELVSVY